MHLACILFPSVSYRSAFLRAYINVDDDVIEQNYADAYSRLCSSRCKVTSYVCCISVEAGGKILKNSTNLGSCTIISYTFETAGTPTAGVHPHGETRGIRRTHPGYF
jgi:hypothetical protein